MKKTTTLSNSHPTEPNRKRIDRLFLSFTAFYGQLWRSQFKSDEFLNFMKNEWFQALQEIEDKNIEEAITHCRNKKEYPPTLPQFIELCKNAKQRDLFKTKPIDEPKDRTPAVAFIHLERIKRLLRLTTK